MPTISHAPPERRAALGTDDLLGLYRSMLRIRLFEERAAAAYQQGAIPGFLHLSVGQEAVPAGTCFALGPDDVITSTHRGHGHVLAKGLDMRGAFAELFGRATGSCRGRGGSMHIADPSLGIFGANGIVGAGNDVTDVALAMRDILGRLRTGGPPVLVEAVTFRVRGHYEGDRQGYRDPETDRRWLTRDPIDRARGELRGRSAKNLDEIEAAVRAEVDDAVAWALAQPEPAPGTLADYLGPAAGAAVRERPLPAGAEPVRMSRAVRAALRHELAADPRVFVAGIDVGAGGNVFGLTRGLFEDFPGPGPRHPDRRERDRRDGGRGGHGRDAPGRGDHVLRLHGGVLRPADQPGRQAPVHDRRPGQRAGARRGHAVDPGRRVRPAPVGDRLRRPGRGDRAPAAVREDRARFRRGSPGPDRARGGAAVRRGRDDRVLDAGFFSIDAPVARVGAPATPVPYAPPLERAWVPTGQQVEAAVRRLMSF